MKERKGEREKERVGDIELHVRMIGLSNPTGPPREAQLIFPIKLVGDELDIGRNRKVVSGNKLSVLMNIDPNPNNVSCSIPIRFYTERCQLIHVAGIRGGIAHGHSG